MAGAIVVRGGKQVTIRNERSAVTAVVGKKVQLSRSGVPGLSAYLIWRALGNTGDEQDFLNDLTQDLRDVQAAIVTKLNTIQEGATDDQTKSEIDALGIDAATVNGKTVETSVPAGAVFTDTETLTSLSINANILTYTDESGAQTNVDLSLYLDDTNLARLTSGTLDGGTGIATFSRDDGSTFTVDFSALIDTTVPIVDGLTSTATDEALSANQGRELAVRDHFMTEAEFMALAKVRRQEFAGSGCIEFGKHYSDTSAFPNVNQGIWTWPTKANSFYWGRTTSGYAGTSKTELPELNIGGFLAKLNLGNDAVAYNPIKVLLPPAPLPINLVPDYQFNSGITEWDGYPDGRQTLSHVDGKLRITNTAEGSGYGLAERVLTTEIGRKYRFEATSFPTATAYNARITAGTASGSSGLGYTAARLADGSKHSLEFVATSTTTYISMQLFTNTPGAEVDFDNAWCICIDELARKDFVFVETFIEDTALKGMYYPGGLIQSQLTTDPSTGLTTEAGTFVGYDTYSLLSEDWQVSGAIVGKGLVISSMSDDDRRKFISNRDNGVFLGADGKEYQIRHRIRVVEGLGADWQYVDPDGGETGYASLRYNSDAYVQAKGQKVSIDTDLKDGALYYLGASATTKLSATQFGNGHFIVRGDATGLPTAYKALCFATPIALVHRRNQCAHDSVFNKNGSSKFYSTSAVGNTGISRFFYEAGHVEPMSLADCCNSLTVWNSATGNIADGRSGRPDGLFYDQVHESDIEDLRKSARKQDLQRTLEREGAKAVAKEFRGKEKIPYMRWIPETVTVGGSALYNSTYDRIYFATSDSDNPRGVSSLVLDGYESTHWYLCGDNGEAMKMPTYNKPADKDHVLWPYSDNAAYLNSSGDVATEFNSKFPIGTKLMVGCLYESDIEYNNTIPRCAAIGSSFDYHRGHYDFLSSDGVQTVDIGTVVKIVSGYTGQGDAAIVGNYYLRVGGTNPNTADLNDHYFNGTSWQDLGPDREDSWLINGVAAEPSLVDEDGNSLIPDGTSKTISLQHRCVNAYVGLRSTDNGNTQDVWASSGTLDTLESTNSVTDSFIAGAIYSIFYSSETDETEEYVTPDEILLSGDVIASDSSRLGDYLINKVMTGTSDDEKCTVLKEVNGVWTHVASSLTSGFKTAISLGRWGNQLGLIVAGEEIDTTDDGAIDTEVNRRRIMLPFFVREDA